jgi:8-oxo-dGTP pyrophosphatase MutT (NUDIX family)
MECANCGKIGHTFRECSDPVTSYGICAVKFIEGIPHYLLICRRDSISYVEFLRGKYRMDQRDYIQLLVNGMTVDERRRLLTTPFTTLWETLWNHQNTRQFRSEYETAQHHFEQIRNTGDVEGRLLVKYVEEASTTWTEPEWGFPKGRRTVREAPVTCALREYGEETGLMPRDVHLVEGLAPLVEEYTGTNGIAYKQVYFVGSCASDSVARHQPANRVMVREVGAIDWFPFETAYLKIRGTNAEKRAVLGVLHHRIMAEELGETLRGAWEWTSVARGGAGTV